MSKTRGRKTIKAGVESDYVGFRAPKTINDVLDGAIVDLKRLGYSDVNKSKLVRSLIEYRLENAVVIYRVQQNTDNRKPLADKK